MKLRKFILLLFFTINTVLGAAINLLDIRQQETEDQHQLNLIFDGMPEYVTSQNYAPAIFTLKLSNTTWNKGDFSEWIQARPALKYSITLNGGFAGRTTLDVKIMMTQLVSVSIEALNDTTMTLSWKKPEDPSKVDLLSREETVFSQKVSLNFRAAALFL